MKIFQEKARTISDEPVWVCINDYYMYIASTFDELIHILNTEWEDKNI